MLGGENVLRALLFPALGEVAEGSQTARDKGVTGWAVEREQQAGFLQIETVHRTRRQFEPE